MGKRSRIRQSIYLYDEKKDIPLHDIFLDSKKGDAIVKDVEEKHEHYHFYRKNGKVQCHIKNEKTGKRKGMNILLGDVTTKIIKKRGIELDD